MALVTFPAVRLPAHIDSADLSTKLSSSVEGSGATVKPLVGGGSTASGTAIVRFGCEGASRVFLSALKPPRLVLDSTHLDHTHSKTTLSRPIRTVPQGRHRRALRLCVVGRQRDKGRGGGTKLCPYQLQVIGKQVSELQVITL